MIAGAAFLGACSLAAVVVICVGTFKVLAARRSLTQHLSLLREGHAIGIDPQRLSAAITRIRRNLDRLPALRARATAAFGTMRQSFNDARLPEAVAAVRIASLAFRALAALR